MCYNYYSKNRKENFMGYIILFIFIAFFTAEFLDAIFGKGDKK